MPRAVSFPQPLFSWIYNLEVETWPGFTVSFPQPRHRGNGKEKINRFLIQFFFSLFFSFYIWIRKKIFDPEEGGVFLKKLQSSIGVNILKLGCKYLRKNGRKRSKLFEILFSRWASRVQKEEEESDSRSEIETQSVRLHPPRFFFLPLYTSISILLISPHRLLTVIWNRSYAFHRKREHTYYPFALLL